MSAKIPILVIGYNRPALVAEVMRVVSMYKPMHLYLACDGPRNERENDEKNVNCTREVMLQAVNWECEIHTLFRESNVGCARGVSEAISWLFAHGEYGVIIEDDVIVGMDFFRLCEYLLPRYENNERIMQISSRNTSNRSDISNTYVYTQVHHCWGWATWRRAWEHMDMQMFGVKNATIPYLVRRLGLFRGCMTYYSFLRYIADKPNQRNDWDTRWYFSILNQDGLVICPGVNLGINIGMTSGEHYSMSDAKSPAFAYQIQPFTWPVVYNDSLKIDLKQKWCDNVFFWKERLYGLFYKRLLFRLLGIR